MSKTAKARRTAFYKTHLALGARMIEFFGWEMPVQYSGILAEHRGVRENVGLFDLSHMGEFEVRGPGARDFLQRLITNELDRIHDGKALYAALCDESGGVLDDLLVYQRAPDDYLVVVNASNIETDWEWFQAHVTDGVELADRSTETALIAVQGPKAAAVVEPVVAQPTDELYYYEFRDDEIAGRPVTLARTGYTGEDGFEVYVENAGAQRVWDALLGSRRAVRHAAGGPGRARHAAARDGLRALRPRADARGQPDRGGPRLGRLVEESVHRQRRDSAAQGARRGEDALRP